MKTANEHFAVRAVSLAVSGALATMFAMSPMAAAQTAENEDIAALTRPTNFVEIGASNVSRDSAKFGEYNGLNKSGADLIGNLSVRGGDSYGGDLGTTRWAITGTDLGTTSRALAGSVSNQGQWSIGLGYDELRHNLSDTYQTYFQGRMGGNTFTAPPTFGRINGNSAALPPYAAGTGASRNLDANQLAAFHREDVATTRKNTSFAAGFAFSPELNIQFDFNRLKQSGAKISSFASIGQTLGGIAYRAEAVAMLMNPTDYTTDNFNLAVNWVGDKGHLTGSYYGSAFSNAYDRVTWDNVQANAGAGICASGGACAYQSNTASTAPDNRFHQLNLSGGYAFSSATKLAGGVSYGRSTQNASFLTGLPEIVSSPTASLNGLVVTKHADLRLTHQATSSLGLTAALKHNERDNRSSSNIYSYHAINSATDAVDNATNAPYSNKKTELELAADYRIDKSQGLRLAYNHEKTTRWCDSMANGFSNCTVSTGTKEDKLSVKYKLKASNDVAFNAGYSYAKRKAEFDHNAVTPLSGLDTGAVTATDVNAQDYPGFVAYIYGSRKQDQVKAGVNWQATEQLDLAVNGRYASDKYYESTLGVQNGKTTGINLDATYSYSEDSSVAAYLSWQNSKRNLRSGASGAGALNTGATFASLVAPTNIWTNQLTDDSTSFGINTKHAGLMGGRLELKGDLSYSLDKTAYNTQLQYTLATCAATNLTSCGALPDIKARVLTLKVTGTYQVDKSSKVALAYVFQQRRTDDYYYNTLQYGYTPSRNMPTNEQAPNYSVNMIGASYIYSFK